MPSLDQTNALALALLFAAAYLVGSINTSLIAARMLGTPDLRDTGSGNAGATNLLRASGWRVAVPVLLVDIGKAAGIVLAARFLGAGELFPAVALPLLLGNIFPVFHRFHGGKGVAAAVGAMLAISPLSVLLCGFVFLAVVAAWRRVSAGSLAMVLSFPIALIVLGASRPAVSTAGLMAGIIAATHRGNIRRLIRGEEKPIFLARSRPSPPEEP